MSDPGGGALEGSDSAARGAGGVARVGPQVFVRLKFRLVAGNLRGDGVRLAGFIITAVFAGALSVLGFLLLAMLRLASEHVAADIAIVLFTAFLVGWAIVPLLAFGLDDTLDPSRLALFPLSTGRLAMGMFAASVTGVWPIAMLIVMLGAVVGLATGVAGAIIGVAAVLLQFALSVVTSRLITTSLSGLLRSRRGRDVLAISVIFFVLTAQLLGLLVDKGMSDHPGAMFHDIASALRWTPPGMAAHAVAVGGPVALAELAFLAVLVVLVGRLWITVLRRALVTPDASTQGASVRNARGLFARILPDGPLAAVVGKEFKYARRDPRGRVGWFACVVITGVMSFSLHQGGEDGSTGLAQAIGPACLGAVMIGLQSANSFGIDGESLWMNSVVYGTGGAWRLDLAGRHLAVAAIAAPLLALLAVVAALVAGEPLLAVPAALTAWGVLGTGIGVGAVTSVLVPYTVPERLNAFTGAAPGQGGIAFVASLLAMVGGGLLALPIVLPVLLGLTWVSVPAVPYGLLVAWAGRRLAGDIGFRRYPELLAAISRAS